MVAPDRRTSVLLLVAIWLPVGVGLPVLVRVLTGDPGADLLPGATALVVGAVGVLIGTVGFVRAARGLDEVAVSGLRSRSGRPLRGRRIVVRIGRGTGEPRGPVPPPTVGREWMAGQVVSLLTGVFGVVVSIGVARDAATVPFVVTTAVICLVPAAIVAVRMRRAERARAHRSGPAAT